MMLHYPQAMEAGISRDLGYPELLLPDLLIGNAFLATIFVEHHLRADIRRFLRARCDHLAKCSTQTWCSKDIHAKGSGDIARGLAASLTACEE